MTLKYPVKIKLFWIFLLFYRFRPDEVHSTTLPQKFYLRMYLGFTNFRDVWFAVRMNYDNDKQGN